MITFDFNVKSGTGGHFDEDGCDLRLVKGVKAPAVPRIGEKFSYYEETNYGRLLRTFLVTDVVYVYQCVPSKVTRIDVYGVPVDGYPLLLSKN